MTDPERVEEPRPDRLPQIRFRLEQGYVTPWIVEDIKWLVGEVELLREDKAILTTAVENLENLIAELGHD